MSISDLYRKSRISSRLLEEALYAETLRELERGIRRDGLWAKALSKCGANQEKAKSLYIEFRVQSLRDELALYNIQMQEKQEKAEAKKPPERVPKKPKFQEHFSEEIMAINERIRIKLTEKLGREPTENEINNAKWNGMC